MDNHHTYMPSQCLLKEMFERYDKHNSGFITPVELKSALDHLQMRPFSFDTTQMIFDMFDSKKLGKIDFVEFYALWKYVVDWKNCFQSFDRDGTGHINRLELKAALFKFGYSISEEVMHTIMRRYDRPGKGFIYFDNFIHACVSLQSLTTSFKQCDPRSEGWIKIHYNQFLEIAFNSSV